MPPIPTTYDEEATQLIASAQRHQRDIAEFQIPRLRTCNGPLSLQQRLHAELREDIDVFGREVQALDMLVADQYSERARKELREVVTGFQDALVKLKTDARGALLASKRLIDSQRKSNREELLKSNATAEKRDLNEKITEDQLMKANNDVTEALQRTINLMQGELERSVLTTQMLDASTASLRSTSSTHDMLTNLMGTSKQIITALEKADWLDRLLIFSALAFFFLVVLFILQQRIVARGLRIAFWWARFLPGGSPHVTEDVLAQAEKGSVSGVMASITTGIVTSIGTSLTTVVTSATSSAAESLASLAAPSSLSDLTSAETPVTSAANEPAEASPPLGAGSSQVLTTGYEHIEL